MRKATMTTRDYWTSYTDKPTKVYAVLIKAKPSLKLIAHATSQIRQVAEAEAIDTAAESGYFV